MRLARDCEERTGAGEVAEVGEQEAMLSLPTGYTGNNACLFVAEDPEKLDGDTTCQTVRTDLGTLQISTILIESPPPPCPAPTESVDVRFHITSAAGTTPHLSSELSPDEQLSWIVDLAGRVTVQGNRLFEPSVNLPRSVLDHPSQITVEFDRPGIYTVTDRRLTEGDSKKKTLEIDLQEDFAVLGGLVFAPVDSNGQFEDLCRPVLNVPAGARLGQAWGKAQSEHDERFDRGRPKMILSEDSYRVPDQLADLLVFTGKDDPGIRIEFADDICRAADEIAVSREALLGTQLTPIVYQAAPLFFVLATSTPDSVQKVGLTQLLETDFWQASLGLAGRIERHDDKTSRFDTTRFELVLNQMKEAPLIGESGPRPLFTSDAVPSLTERLLEEINGRGLAYDVLDVANDLQARVQQMSKVAGERAPNARILLLGPQLGWRHTICSKFDGTTRSLADWLKAGGARLATIEVVRDEDSDSANREAFTPTDVEHLFSCDTAAVWKDVARGYVIGRDGLVGGHRQAVFDAIYADLQTFFAIDDVGLRQ